MAGRLHRRALLTMARPTLDTERASGGTLILAIAGGGVGPNESLRLYALFAVAGVDLSHADVVPKLRAIPVCFRLAVRADLTWLDHNIGKMKYYGKCRKYCFIACDAALRSYMLRSSAECARTIPELSRTATAIALGVGPSKRRRAIDTIARVLRAETSLSRQNTGQY